MPTKFKIHYPVKETIKSDSFPAFGWAPPGVAKVVGILEDDATGKKIAHSYSIEDPPQWILFFEKVPKGGPYNLRVEIPYGPVLGYAWDIMVDPAYGLQILVPASNGSTMCQSNCVSSGYTDGGDPSGTMTLGGVQTQGVLRQRAPNWIIQFPSTIAVGSPYQLDITSDKPTQSRTGLKVNNC
jgi:hypothetical protein